jgi:ribonuclease HI
MGAHDEIARLLKEAATSMKSDVKGAVAKLESAYAIARETGVADDTAVVAEELARGWARRKSTARALYYARKATELSPEAKAAWTTMAKTCELVASRTSGDPKLRRAQALYRGAALAFKKAASLTKDPEDKRWLLELAGDAARQAKPPSAT